MHKVHTQCKLLYVSNYLNPSFDLFTSLLFHHSSFLRFLCIEDVAHLNCHPFSPIFSYLNPFSPVLLHVLCYKWMVDYDDGEDTSQCVELEVPTAKPTHIIDFDG